MVLSPGGDIFGEIKLFLFKVAKSVSDQVSKLSRNQKRLLLLGADLFIFLLSLLISFSLYRDSIFPKDFIAQYIPALCLTIPIKFVAFYWMGMYKSILRYSQASFVNTALKGVAVAAAGSATLGLFLGINILPRTIQVLDGLLTLFLVIFSRTITRWFLYKFSSFSKLGWKNPSLATKDKPVIIYGAGQAGFELYQALDNDHTFKAVAFVDDNPQLWKHSLGQVKIYRPADLEKLIRNYQVDLIFLAIPSASPQRKQEIFSYLKQYGLEVKTVPAISEIITGKFSISQLRNIEITDLLGRDEVLPEPSLLSVDITDKSVLVTGAGGSIGAELCRQIARQKPKQLVLYELNEFALYTIDLELSESFPHLRHTACLGSVTDRQRLEEVLREQRVETVYHAAAYKHVPLVELNAAQGVLNNIYGTLVCTEAAGECLVEKFVLISTDKAVRPTNIMGTTKRVAELILQAKAKENPQGTEFTMVRFGNVLNSNGSVVPRFAQQIKERRPITITHPEITRYFMSIPEAARLVIQAGAMAEGGEVFLLDMGEPVKIYDLATQMIELSGLVPGQDIEIVITGLRPGEKLYEELLIEASRARKTKHPKIFVAAEKMMPWEELEPVLDRLFMAAKANDYEQIVNILQQLVPEYQKSPARV